MRIGPSTPKQDAARATNWLYFQVASAVGNLGWVMRRVRLPDPRDDADLREALTLLTGIDRRRVERRDLNRKETK